MVDGDTNFALQDLVRPITATPVLDGIHARKGACPALRIFVAAAKGALIVPKGFVARHAKESNDSRSPQEAGPPRVFQNITATESMTEE